MTRRPKIGTKYALASYQRFVATLIRSIGTLHKEDVKDHLRQLGHVMRTAHGLPKDATQLEITLEEFISTVDVYVSVGGDIEILKDALRERARIREDEL